MEVPGAVSVKGMPQGLDATTEEEYASQSRLIQEFTDISSIDKAWIFKSVSGNSSQAMFLLSQMNLLANKRRIQILSSNISGSSNSVNFQWSPFPVEMVGVSTIVPSPSGLKLLVVRNKENGSPTQLEIWGPAQLQKEIHIPQSVHGSIYTDGWFEGISWSYDETLIAYVAEEPPPSKPVFDGLGYKKGGSGDKDCGSWKGQGEWEEEWGETYSGKRKPALFVVSINSGDVQAVEGVEKSFSVGQVVWAPSAEGLNNYLVFVGWSSNNGPQEVPRKLGIKYCYNRPCALYSVRAPFHESNAPNDLATVVHLTQGISSAFFPRFSPDGKSLIFLSAKSAVDSGAHWATNSLHRMDWPGVGKQCPSLKIVDVVKSFLSLLQFRVLKIPVSDTSENLTEGAKKPFEAIFISNSNCQTEESCKEHRKEGGCNPLIVILHGGPHSVSISSYSKSLAFLSSLGYNLLLVNYRGSLGYGEEALQSLPGKVGQQDVKDVLTAIDHVIEMGLADSSRVAVLGGSHGGFLTTHLIGQAPDRFVAAAVRNPVCNLSLMVGTTDIPDWCYVEACGSIGKTYFTEAPSVEDLCLFYNKSPISHLSKVKVPVLFLLGAQDLRVPVSNGLQYARALREKGVEVKVIMFPNDVHGIDRPQSDFESFLNIGVWFKKYCK
eukprot:TRINITY_DN1494_c0_g1_i1.p1 TRINITY_DN1494_c0_g1~~TRINITY_DN1494_c0_g1_i1.p1  ORF type:complete len:713 (+),score=132.54 TRINITY_DN1494_c0_g1_i1:156-2141(+)